jgi:hypothetical protein
MFKNSVYTTNKIHCISIVEIREVIVFMIMEILYAENQIKHIEVFFVIKAMLLIFQSK